MSTVLTWLAILCINHREEPCHDESIGNDPIQPQIQHAMKMKNNGWLCASDFGAELWTSAQWWVGSNPNPMKDDMKDCMV
jgi:hypothetical protein